MATTADTATGESGSRLSAPDHRAEPDDTPVVTRAQDGAPTQLELVADDHALSILEALEEGPKRGRELIDACDGSRATVYRRLDRLNEAGFVTAEVTLDPDGHHCNVFNLVRDTVRVTVENGGLTVTVESR